MWPVWRRAQAKRVIGASCDRPSSSLVRRGYGHGHSSRNLIGADPGRPTQTIVNNEWFTQLKPESVTLAQSSHSSLVLRRAVSRGGGDATGPHCWQLLNTRHRLVVHKIIITRCPAVCLCDLQVLCVCRRLASGWRPLVAHRTMSPYTLCRYLLVGAVGRQH